MDLRINSMLKTYGITKPTTTTSSKKTSETAKKPEEALEVSNTVFEYKNTLEAVKGTDDVREDVVAKYKGLINSGNYNVSVSDLADKLLNV